MPLYEYQCQSCGEEFEQVVRLSEADRNPACPRCQSEETLKKISRVGSLGSSANPGAHGSACSSTGRFT